MDKAGFDLYRRMLVYTVEEEGGGVRGGACCVAAGGGKGGAKRDGREGRKEGEYHAVVTAEPSVIVYHTPAQDLR